MTHMSSETAGWMLVLCFITHAPLYRHSTGFAHTRLAAHRSRERRVTLHLVRHDVHREPLAVAEPVVGLLRRVLLGGRLDIGPSNAELLRGEAVPVVSPPHQVRAHGGGGVGLRGHHQRGGAQRQAVAAVHLPGAPELAERGGQVVQLRLLQRHRHVRARPQAWPDLVRVRVPQPLLLRRQRVEDLPRHDVLHAYMHAVHQRLVHIYIYAAVYLAVSTHGKDDKIWVHTRRCTHRWAGRRLCRSRRRRTGGSPGWGGRRSGASPPAASGRASTARTCTRAASPASRAAATASPPRPCLAPSTPPWSAAPAARCRPQRPGLAPVSRRWTPSYIGSSSLCSALPLCHDIRPARFFKTRDRRRRELAGRDTYGARGLDVADGMWPRWQMAETAVATDKCRRLRCCARFLGGRGPWPTKVPKRRRWARLGWALSSLPRPRAHPSAKWQTHHGHHFATASFLPDAVVDDPKHLHHGLRRRRCFGGTDTETARRKTEGGSA